MTKNNKVKRSDMKEPKENRILIPKSESAFKQRGAKSDFDINELIAKIDNLDVDPRTFCYI